MAQILKQSTAVDVIIGPFVDSTDGNTEETALSIASTDVKLSKNGQTMAGKNDVTACAHDANGMYNCELDATDTNTVGQLTIFVHVSGALAVRHDYQVMEEATYDALFGASAAGFDANGRVDVGKWLGTAVTTSATTNKPEVDVNSISDDATAANNAELMFDGTGYAGGTTKLQVDTVAVSGDTVAADNMEADYDGTGFNKSNSTIGTCTTNTDLVSAASIADAVWDETISAHIANDSAAAHISQLRSNTAQAGASTTITLDTGANATDDYYNDGWIAIIQGTGAGQTRLITDYVGSTKVATVSPAWTTNPSSDSEFLIVPSAQISGASAPTAAAIADAVWDEAQSGHTTAGTFGKYLDTEVSGVSGGGSSNPAILQNTTIATLASQTAFTLTAGSADDDAYNGMIIVIQDQSTSTQKAVGRISDYTGSTKSVTLEADPAIFTMAVGDTVDILAVTNHITTVDTVTNQVTADVTAISGDATAANNAESFFDGTGYAGTNNVIPTVTSVTNQVTADVTAISGDSVAADNCELMFDGTGYAGGTTKLDVNIASSDDIDLTATQKASVNAEVDTALITTTYAEPSSVPAATSSIKDKLNWLFALARNKMTQTATTQTLRNDADGANIATSTVSDDGTTFTRGEYT